MRYFSKKAYLASTIPSLYQGLITFGTASVAHRDVQELVPRKQPEWPRQDALHDHRADGSVIIDRERLSHHHGGGTKKFNISPIPLTKESPAGLTKQIEKISTVIDADIRAVLDALYKTTKAGTKNCGECWFPSEGTPLFELVLFVIA